MSFITSLSVKDHHKNEYNAMRIWLKQKNISMGDYLIEKYTSEFESKVKDLTNKN